MKLYLVRHGQATTEQENPSRPLTEVGREEVLKVAKFLKKPGIEVDAIWHSTKQRAIETAQIMAEILERKELCREISGLKPNDSIQPISEKIQEMACSEAEPEGLMIVGHLPFLEKMASFLLTDSPAEVMIQFYPSGVVQLEWTVEKHWKFVWAVVPRVIP